MSKEYIEREALLKDIQAHKDKGGLGSCVAGTMERYVKRVPTADVVEVEKVAEMLRLIFIDDCACNYNGNDEWLPMVCKYAEADCPMPKERLGCWKEFVKHFIAKMDGTPKERGGEE